MKGQKSVMMEKTKQPTAIDDESQQAKERTKRNAYAERKLAFDEGLISDELVQEFDNIKREYQSEFKDLRARTAKKFVDKGIEILEKTGMARGRIRNIVIAYGCDLGWDPETIGHQWPERYKDPGKIKGGKARAKKKAEEQRYFETLEKKDPDKLSKIAEKGGHSRSKDTEEMEKIAEMSVRSRTTAADMETLVHQTTVYCPFDIVFRENELKQMVDKKEVWVRILDKDRYDILRAIPA